MTHERGLPDLPPGWSARTPGGWRVAGWPRDCCTRCSELPPRLGHGRVGLEVDADSPTRAGLIYVSTGWTTDHVTESWFRDVATR